MNPMWACPDVATSNEQGAITRSHGWLSAASRIPQRRDNDLKLGVVLIVLIIIRADMSGVKWSPDSWLHLE